MFPIEYPTFTLRDGRTFYLRFSLGSTIRMKKWGVDLTKATADPEENWQQLAAQFASVASIKKGDDETATYEPAGLTPEDVLQVYFDPAEEISCPELWEMGDMRKALTEAVAFRRPSGENSQSDQATANPGS